jgi:hypothetical protein
MKNDLKTLSILGQWLAVLLFSCGIFIEIIYHADFGFLVITCGGFVFSVFTKIKCLVGGEK